jgi:hypothetical protein
MKTDSPATQNSIVKIDLLVTQNLVANWFASEKKFDSKNYVVVDAEIINAKIVAGNIEFGSENWFAGDTKFGNKKCVVANIEFVNAVQSYDWRKKSSVYLVYWLRNCWWKLSRCRPRNHQHNPVLRLTLESSAYIGYC